MIKTKANQTPYELSVEFIEGMKNLPSGGKDMDDLFDVYLAMEREPSVPPAIIEQIQHVCHTDLDATNTEFIKNTKINILNIGICLNASKSG